MSKFEEWWEENFMLVSADRTEAEDIYNLGKQSQQAKIDELQGEIQGYKRIYGELELNRDELQGRIDEALRHVVDHGGYDDLTHVISILKGNKDEN